MVVRGGFCARVFPRRYMRNDTWSLFHSVWRHASRQDISVQPGSSCVNRQKASNRLIWHVRKLTAIYKDQNDHAVSGFLLASVIHVQGNSEFYTIWHFDERSHGTIASAVIYDPRLVYQKYIGIIIFLSSGVDDIMWKPFRYCIAVFHGVLHE